MSIRQLAWQPRRTHLAIRSTTRPNPTAKFSFYLLHDALQVHLGLLHTAQLPHARSGSYTDQDEQQQ